MRNRPPSTAGNAAASAATFDAGEPVIVDLDESNDGSNGVDPSVLSDHDSVPAEEALAEIS
eukprot:2599146-Pleurochrysis_carterae.AAC.1